MLRLHGLSWDTHRIVAALGWNRDTVQRHLTVGSWAACGGPGRPSELVGHEAWLVERFRRHRDNADVVRQELAGQLGVSANRRTVRGGTFRRDRAELVKVPNT